MGPVACGIQTGAGAVMRSLACRPGSSIVVLGGGSVGLSAAMAAVVQGCTPIIVSEPVADRRALALELGATGSEKHTPELQSLIRTPYAVFCLKKKKKNTRRQIKLDIQTHN